MIFIDIFLFFFFSEITKCLKTALNLSFKEEKPFNMKTHLHRKSCLHASNVARFLNTVHILADMKRSIQEKSHFSASYVVNVLVKGKIFADMKEHTLGKDHMLASFVANHLLKHRV